MTRQIHCDAIRGVFRGIFPGAFPGALVLLCSAAMISSCGRIPESSDRIADPGERVFSTARLVDVSVEMDPDDLYAMRKRGLGFW